MIIEIEIAFLGKSNGIDIAMFRPSVTRLRYHIVLEGTAIAQAVTEWVLYPLGSDHADYLGEKNLIYIEFFVFESQSNREGENHNCHITIPRHLLVGRGLSASP